MTLEMASTTARPQKLELNVEAANSSQQIIKSKISKPRMVKSDVKDTNKVYVKDPSDSKQAREVHSVKNDNENIYDSIKSNASKHGSKSEPLPARHSLRQIVTDDPITRDDLLNQTRVLLEVFLKNELLKRQDATTSAGSQTALNEVFRRDSLSQQQFGSIKQPTAQRYSSLPQGSLERNGSPPPANPVSLPTSHNITRIPVSPVTDERLPSPSGHCPLYHPQNSASIMRKQREISPSRVSTSGTHFVIVATPKEEVKPRLAGLTDVEDGFERDASSTSDDDQQPIVTIGRRKKKTLFRRAREQLKSRIDREKADGRELKLTGQTAPPKASQHISDSSNDRNHVNPKSLRRPKKNKSKMKSPEKKQSLLNRITSMNKKKEKPEEKKDKSKRKFGWFSKQFTCVEHLEKKAKRLDDDTSMYAYNMKDSDDVSFGFSAMLPATTPTSRNLFDGEETPVMPGNAASLPGPATEPNLVSSSSIDSKKESVYSQIADRLHQIADDFMANNEFGPELQQLAFIDDDEDDEVSREKHINSLTAMAHTSDNSDSVIRALITGPPQFGQVMREYLSNQTDPQLQLALVFAWTGHALVHLTARGLTHRASNLVNDCVHFVNTRFGSWLIGQGGYASALEHTTESELD